MRLLLDTHAFIWWDSEPERLPRKVLRLCRDPRHELLLSVVSLWEIQIKRQLGKLRLALPWDPFDRLLVAQAPVENAVLLSGDAHLARYPVQVIW